MLHNQPGRRFATGSSREDQLLGLFGFAAHAVLFTAIGLTLALALGAGWEVAGLFWFLSIVMLVVRGMQVGTTTTVESFAAIKKAWIGGLLLAAFVCSSGCLHAQPRPPLVKVTAISQQDADAAAAMEMALALQKLKNPVVTKTAACECTPGDSCGCLEGGVCKCQPKKKPKPVDPAPTTTETKTVGSVTYSCEGGVCRPVVTYSTPTYVSPPVYSTPVYSTPTYSTPVYSQPVYSTPVYSQPVYSQPTYSYPAYRQPTYYQPTYSQPVFGGFGGGRVSGGGC